jgi:hypothetical protein
VKFHRIDKNDFRINKYCQVFNAVWRVIIMNNNTNITAATTTTNCNYNNDNYDYFIIVFHNSDGSVTEITELHSYLSVYSTSRSKYT